MINQKTDAQWEAMCHRCAKCCHAKYDLFVFFLADPLYVCKYLTNENSCEIYQQRLSKDDCSCISLREAVTKTGLLPKDCAYIHLNLNHKVLIFPKSEEDFWELIKFADNTLRQNIPESQIDVISFVLQRRKEMQGFKPILEATWFKRLFLIN